MTNARWEWTAPGGGDFGSMGSKFAGRTAPTKMGAVNLVAYRNGDIGPRAGLRDMGVTGTAAGLVWGLFWRGTSGSDLGYVQGTAVKLIDAGAAANAVQSVAGALAITPTRPVAWVEGPSPRTYITVYGDKAYYVDHTAKTLTAVTSSFGTGAICFYGERLMTGGTAANPGRVYYTEAGVFTTQPAANFFDVGDGRGEVRGLFAQRGFLSIVLSNGEWWILTGVPGVNDVLRKVTANAQHPWVLAENACASLGDDTVAYVPLSAGWPAAFDGARVQEKRWLDFLGNSETTDSSPFFVRTVKGFKPEEFAQLGGKDSGIDYRGRALLFRNGIHTFHDFDVSTDALAASDGQGRLFLTDRGTGAVAPKFYFWKLNLDRPGFAADAYSRAGDDDNTSATPMTLTLPELFAAPGTEIVPQTVTVEFTSWQHGGSFTNGFDLFVDGYDQDESSGVSSTGVQVSSTVSFSESQGSSTTEGMRRRKTFGILGVDPAGALRVRFNSIQGCSFTSVALDYEVVAGRGRP